MTARAIAFGFALRLSTLANDMNMRELGDLAMLQRTMEGACELIGEDLTPIEAECEDPDDGS